MTFNTFVAVYTVKNLLQVAALLKYCKVVRDIAKKSGNWRYYDQQFCYLRQTNQKKFPWARVMWELWNQAIHVTSKSPQDNTQNKKPKSAISLLSKGCVLEISLRRILCWLPIQAHVLSAVPHIPQISVRPSPVSSMHPHLERTEKDLPHLNCGPTPVKPHRLELLLRGYDPAIATYLVNGFHFGFAI